jgi:hypothetical protein
MHTPTGEVKPTTEESTGRVGERLVAIIARNTETKSAIQSSERRQKISRLTANQNGEMKVMSVTLNVAEGPVRNGKKDHMAS